MAVLQDSGNMSLPYWLVNVPRKDWPSECPPYLIDLSDKDKVILATRDEDYRDLTWNEVKEVVGKLELSLVHQQRLQLLALPAVLISIFSRVLAYGCSPYTRAIMDKIPIGLTLLSHTSA